MDRAGAPATLAGALAVPVLVALVLRDAALLAGALALWCADAALRAESGVLPVVVAVATGAGTALCGYLAHEWGHLLGALVGGARVHLPPNAWTVFLFRFDADCNTRAQFLRMSVGGFAATAVVVALLVAVLPMEALSGRVALGLTALGVVATAVLELPPAWRVWRGAPIPHGAAYVSQATDRPG